MIADDSDDEDDDDNGVPSQAARGVRRAVIEFVANQYLVSFSVMPSVP